MLVCYRDPEPIYASLFAKFSSLKPTPFITMSRRWQHWSGFSGDLQPALFQVQSDPKTMNYSWGADGMPIIKAWAELVIYCRTEDEGQPMSPKINQLVNAVLGMIEPPAFRSDKRCPLFDDSGNQVAYTARVNGDIEMVEGVTGQNAQSVAYIPIEIVVTF